jgi:hypothetical protein
MDVLTAVLLRVQVFMGYDAVTLGHRFRPLWAVMP